MANMGEMADQQTLSEPLPDTVDSPCSSTHAGLVMSPSPTEPLATISRSVVVGTADTSHQSLDVSGAVLEGTHLEEESEIKEEDDLAGNCSVTEDLSGEEAVSLASPGDAKQAGLSVIVQPHDHDQDDNDPDHEDQDQEDSHDSELLSPGKLSPTSGISVSVASMIDATDFRALQPEPTYQTLTSVNGRMSPPGFSPTSSYATLTPLQPLPPISTMSDKFAYGHASNVSGSFTVMQNNGLGNIGLGMGVNSPYSYDKLPSMGMSPPHHYSSPNNGLGSISIPQQHSPLSPQSSYSQNGLQSPQKSMSPNSYDSPYTQRDLVGRGTLVAPHSPNLSPPSTSLHSPPNTIVTSFGGTVTSMSSASLPTINGLTTITPHTALHISPHHSPPSLLIQHIHRDSTVQMTSSPSPPSFVPLQQPSTPLAIKTVPSSGGGSLQASSGVSIGGGPGSGSGEVEEINTKELAQRISAELKRYSIPQAIFAQRVLCRSQGTLSDLLRNPKPWSKLKSGRETFRRMWKWLQEPEFQRMSALRLAGMGPPCRAPSPRNCSTPDHNSVQIGFVATGINGKCWNSSDAVAPWDINTVDFNYVEAAQIPQRGTCKRKEDPSQNPQEHTPAPKKPRLVFTDLQRRTLQAIFKETKRPSKEMQVTIARQLGLEPTTVGNFFMNARRRSMDKWKDEDPNKSVLSAHESGDEDDHSPEPVSNHGHQLQQSDSTL